MSVFPARPLNGPRVHSESVRLLGPIIGAGIVRIAAAGSSFAVTVALARLLGSKDYGTYAFVTSVILLAATAGKWGWDKATVRFVSQYLAQQDFAHLRAFLAARRRSLAKLAMGAAICCGLWLALSPLPVSLPTLLVACMVVPASIAGLLLQANLRGAASTTLCDVPEAILKPAVLVALTAAALTFSASGDVVFAATSALFLASLLSNALCLKFQARLPFEGLKHTQPASVHPTFWNAAVGQYGVLGFAQIALTRLPVALSGTVLGAEEVGRIAVSTRLADAVGIAITSIGLVSAPRISALYHSRKITECENLLRQATVYSSVIGLAVCGVLVLSGRQVLRLFGPNFAEAYPLLAIMCVAQAIASVCGPVGYLATMSGHQGEASRITVMAACVSVGLTLTLAPLFGSIGVAIALAVAVILSNILLTRLARTVLADCTVATNRTVTADTRETP
ncbi:MAG: polysaccharide biosynthesis protein [Gammaproteobacteria bacterium]|nr:polysaccharide biosynthesis protein [Gammaproteobacteria bacterium]